MKGYIQRWNIKMAQILYLIISHDFRYLIDYKRVFYQLTYIIFTAIWSLVVKKDYIEENMIYNIFCNVNYSGIQEQ